MLGKLLKYDLKSIFKYWWLFAVSSVGVSVLGAVSLLGFTSAMQAATETDFSVFIGLMCFFAFLFSLLALSAFIIVAEILIYVRFYKNLFSDEGYLTFTLPVKRHQLLTSKLIMAIITEACTVTLFFVEIVSIFLVGLGPLFLETFGLDSIGTLFEALGLIFAELGVFSVIYIIEALLLSLVTSAFSVLLVFACISFGSMIAKKHKVLASVGIYYLVNSVVSSGYSLVYLFGSSLISSIALTVPQGFAMPIVAVALLVAIAIVAALAMLLYTLVHYMLDKKLNLA